MNFNKAKHYSELYKKDIEKLADELYRYEKFNDDIRWTSDRGENRNTSFIINKKFYSVHMLNGKLFSVSVNPHK